MKSDSPNHSASAKYTTVYTTVEGHPIVVGGKYVTRGGDVVEVVKISRDEDVYYPVITNKFNCDEYGFRISQTSPSSSDLMRPHIKTPAASPIKTLHDEYTMLALSKLIECGRHNLCDVVRLARGIADEAMKARGE